MRAVDTNLLVRLIARDDPKQTEAAERFVNRGAWVSHLVLAETVWVLSSVYDIDDDGVSTAVEMLLNHRDLVVQDADVVSAALDQFRDAASTSFTDCLILEIARKAGHLPLGTFDRTLSRVAGAQKV